ncbi:MAG: PAS domain-containing protein [Rubrivivax sp.]|nr:PAS domain-containing protein [Rubrivivax sp.]
MELERLEGLRLRAAARLTGPAASKGAAVREADALAVLHALASSPATASDALTVLHELQVRQVELDLQAQELHESRAELESAFRRQVELYDHQPVGCFTIDAQRVLHELNMTGADMLGIPREEAYGSRLDAFFCAESGRRFASALSRLDARAPRSTCLLKLRPKAGAERQVLASLGADPAAQRYLVNLTPVGDEGAHTSDAA